MWKPTLSIKNNGAVALPPSPPSILIKSGIPDILFSFLRFISIAYGSILSFPEITIFIPTGLLDNS